MEVAEFSFGIVPIWREDDLVQKPIADPFMIFPDRRPTLHEHCKRHQNCTGPGCRAKGHRWPSSKQRHFQKIAKSDHEGFNPEPRPIPHRVVDLLPAMQVIALWEFRQGLIAEEGKPVDKTMHAITRREAVYLPAEETQNA